MNGHFEINETAYPIGYLTGIAGYKVTDMRNMHTLHSHPITKEQAVRIASEANAALRAGKFTLQDGDTGAFDFVQEAVKALEQ